MPERASPGIPLGPAQCQSQQFSLVLGQVSILTKDTVRMRQPGRVLEIIGALRKGGGDRLQVPPGRGRGRLGRSPARGAADTFKASAPRNGR